MNEIPMSPGWAIVGIKKRLSIFFSPPEFKKILEDYKKKK